MTVTAEDTLTRYAADGVTTTYAAGFYVESEDQLSVYFNDDLVSTSNWSYSEGFITFTAAPINGAMVCIQRNTDLSRPTSYQNNTNSFVPKTLDQDVDRTWFAIQELATKFKSVLSLQISDGASPTALLADLRQLLVDLPAEVLARIAGDNEQRSYADGLFNSIAPLVAATADAEALLRSYIDNVIMNVSFPLDCGLISDPVINNRFDLGAL
jgi:hypothetical protein